MVAVLQKNLNLRKLFVEWIIKNLFFTDIWYPFCQWLLIPADVTFLKNYCNTHKFLISAFQNHLQTKSKLHILIRQSKFIKSFSLWDSLYEQILIIEKLPGEFEMASTTAISSYSFFVEGKKYKTNPIEKMTRRRRPHKLMEAWLHFLFLSF